MVLEPNSPHKVSCVQKEVRVVMTRSINNRDKLPVAVQWAQGVWASLGVWRGGVAVQSAVVKELARTFIVGNFVCSLG